MSLRPILVSSGFLLFLGLLVSSVEPTKVLRAQEVIKDKVEEKKVVTPKEDTKKEDIKNPVIKGKKKAEEPKVEEAPPKPEEPIDPIKQAEKILQEGKIKSDPATLKEFFKTRTLSDAARKSLNDLIEKLGDDDFDIRENASNQLTGAGLAAVPTLRAATRSKDVEVNRRIDFCLRVLNQENESGRVISAALLLANQKVENTPRILLNYLPCVPDDESIHEGVRNALILFSRQMGKADPLIVEMLTNKDREMRAMAVQILGEALPETRPAVKKLLQDPDPKVRFTAAQTLARMGDKSVIPELLKLLTDSTLEYAYLTEDMMFQLLGDGKMSVTLSGDDKANRLKCREAWETWWKENESKIDLVKLTTGEAIKGFTVVVEVDQFNGGNGGQGRVWECGADGKQRWEWTNVNGPVDIQKLPGGKFLLAEYYNSCVTERDREGKILWTSPRQNSNTVAAQRLANGNTLIATMAEVVEVKKDGTRVGEPFPRPTGTVYQVRQAKNGHTFILAGNELWELNGDRKDVRKIPIPGGLSGWSGFDFLPNGNFLIAYYGSGRKYAEIDAKGKVVHENVVACDPTRVQHLRNGNTLVAGGNTMFCAEYDRDKKEVWKVTTKGRPFAILRY